MFEIKELCGRLCIGRQGENLARLVYFDELSTWKETFGEGRCELLHQRNGDSAPYPIALSVEGDGLCWKITNIDTAFEGEGKCELRYYVDNVAVKSKIMVTQVLPSLGDHVAEPPDPYKDWVDAVLNAAAYVEGATTHQPMVGENKNWFVWNGEEYVDTGVCAEGEPGQKGDPGTPGEKGDPGDPGEPGYTPVKGVDYFTQTDKAEIASDARKLKILKTITLEEDVARLNVEFDKPLDELAILYNIAFTKAETSRFATRGTDGVYLFYRSNLSLSTNMRYWYAHAKEVGERQWVCLISEWFVNNNGLGESMTQPRTAFASRANMPSRYIKNIDIFIPNNTTENAFAAGSKIQIWGHEVDE